MVVQAQTEDIKTIFDIHHLLGYLVAGFLITVFVMIFYNRLIFFRERDVTQQSKQLIDQLSLIMTANKTEVWIYNVKQDLYKTLGGEKTSEATYSPFEFSQFYDREDFVELLKTMSKMRESVVESKTIISSVFIRLPYQSCARVKADSPYRSWAHSATSPKNRSAKNKPSAPP